MRTISFSQMHNNTIIYDNDFIRLVRKLPKDEKQLMNRNHDYDRQVV